MSRMARSRVPGVVGLGILGLVCNNVSSSDYTALVTLAILSSSLALLLTVSSWSYSSRTARILLGSFAFLSLLTLVDAAGRRLPAMLGWF
jgi:hypothetical protein